MTASPLPPSFEDATIQALVNGAWTLVATGVADDKLRAPPFEEIELDLAELWAAPVTPQES